MDFINKMDNGLDTVIGENGCCSLVVSVSVLLSLEPCCVMPDTDSGRSYLGVGYRIRTCVQAALDELQKNRTSLVIAHRCLPLKRQTKSWLSRMVSLWKRYA